jgi:hypothetical protein
MKAGSVKSPDWPQNVAGRVRVNAITPEQRELLEDKLQIWRWAAKEGNMELRDYNRRCADALEAALSTPPQEPHHD